MAWGKPAPLQAVTWLRAVYNQNRSLSIPLDTWDRPNNILLLGALTQIFPVYVISFNYMAVNVRACYGIFAAHFLTEF